MKTYQDFEKAPDVIEFIRSAINDHRSSDKYKIAVTADEYERQLNTTIRAYTKYLYTATGQKVVDFTSSNNKLCNNFFHRLNTQRCTYSLGNGLTFDRSSTKDALGPDFDTDFYFAAYAALIHGECYLFWNMDKEFNPEVDAFPEYKAYVFPITEFVPLLDEETGSLRAGIRFWSLDWGKKPVDVVLFTEDGYTRYRTKPGSVGLDLMEYHPQRSYKYQFSHTKADGYEVVGESNYGSLPIVPVYGSRKKQSTLVGMRDKLDAYDLIQSGFANDLQDCAEIYWIINNAMGMTQAETNQFRDRLKLQHIAVADMDNSAVTPYVQDIPSNSRKTFLDEIRNSIYEDFGGLDVHTVAAGSTNDHIDAAYQPMDEEADDFEYQLIQAVRAILALMGIDDIPKFSRNRISNVKERLESLMMLADYLDDRTILEKSQMVTVDEIPDIMARKATERADRMPSAEELNKQIESEDEAADEEET